MPALLTRMLEEERGRAGEQIVARQQHLGQRHQGRGQAVGFVLHHAALATLARGAGEGQSS